MIHVFLDANILLGLHGLTPREVGELNKIPALIHAEELTLWLPEVVLDEYERNRARVVAEALKSLRESRLAINPPALSEDHQERVALQKAMRATHKAHSELLEALEKAAAEQTLPADKAVKLLRDSAEKPPTGPVLDKARLRRELRRPPGKADSLGDAISWECLLRDVPEFEDLHLVSSDPDFRSPWQRPRSTSTSRQSGRDPKRAT
ncbi:MAG: PIN domain-containing protein [Pseudomonas sp.]